VLHPKKKKIIDKTKVKESFPLCFLIGVLWFLILHLSPHSQLLFNIVLEVQDKKVKPEKEIKDASCKNKNKPNPKLV
jgi:hypothetical protein